MRRFLHRLKAGTEELNYGREILVDYATEVAADRRELRVLDIGLGTGTDLINIRTKCCALYPHLSLELHGLEAYPPNVEQARSHGITVSQANIESDRFPYPDQCFDLVVANQIIEHTKEIFWIYGEISRVLAPGGFVLTGVPNLASFHNRIALLFGIQPTSIELLGPHVRGVTKPGFRKFIEADGYFLHRTVKGSNFYPFRPRLSKILSRLLPSMSVGLFFKTERTSKPGNFVDVLKTRFFETNFFTGTSAQNP